MNPTLPRRFSTVGPWEASEKPARLAGFFSSYSSPFPAEPHVGQAPPSPVARHGGRHFEVQEEGSNQAPILAYSR